MPLDLGQLLLLKLLHDYTFLGPKILKIKPKKTQHLKLQLPHQVESNKLRWNITEKNSSWGKRSCQRVNQAWDKPGRHGFWSQEKFPNLVLRNLKPKKYSTTLSLGRKMAGTSAATWATSASWRNWESWNFLYPNIRYRRAGTTGRRRPGTNTSRAGT